MNAAEVLTAALTAAGYTVQTRDLGAPHMALILDIGHPQGNVWISDPDGNLTYNLPEHTGLWARQYPNQDPADWRDVYTSHTTDLNQDVARLIITLAALKNTVTGSPVYQADSEDDGLTCPNGNRPPECTEIDLCEPCTQDADAEAEVIEASMGLHNRTRDHEAQATYLVTAYGIAHTEFTYRVTAPRNAREIDVAREAYGIHGQALRAGNQTEPLGPLHSVETLS